MNVTFLPFLEKLGHPANFWISWTAGLVDGVGVIVEAAARCFTLDDLWRFLDAAKLIQVSINRSEEYIEC